MNKPKDYEGYKINKDPKAPTSIFDETGNGTNFPVPGTAGQVLKLKNNITVDETITTEDLEWGDETGTGGTVSVAVAGTETTEPGTQAQVENIGTEQNVELFFSIPKGEQGPKGDNATFPTATEGQILVANANGEFQATDDLKQTTQNITALQEEVQEIKNGPLTNIAGGTTGQVLIKKSNADYDYGWMDDSGSGGSTHKLYRIQLNKDHIADDALYVFTGDQYKDIRDNAKWDILPMSTLENYINNFSLGFVFIDSSSGNKCKSGLIPLKLTTRSGVFWIISTIPNNLCEVSLSDYQHIYNGFFSIAIMHSSYKVEQIDLYYYATYGDGTTTKISMNPTSDSFLYFWN